MFDIIKSNPLLWLVIFLAVVARSFLFGAVKVVLYIILGIILLFILISAIFSVKIQNMRSRMEDQMRGGAQGNQNPFGQQSPFGNRGNAQNSTEGDIKVVKTQSVNEKRINKDVGDYVDFEEIKK